MKYWFDVNVDLPKLKCLSCSAKSTCENFQYYGRGVFYGILIVLMMIIDVPKLKSDDIEFPSSVFQRLISIDSKSILKDTWWMCRCERTRKICKEEFILSCNKWFIIVLFVV